MTEATNEGKGTINNSTDAKHGSTCMGLKYEDNQIDKS